MCSLESRQIAKLDADYFCASFYGKDYSSTSYEVGRYDESGKLGYQMHKGPGCQHGYHYGIHVPAGETIMGTDCTGVPCKIVSSDNNHRGLYDIVCTKNSGEIIHIGCFIENSVI